MITIARFVPKDFVGNYKRQDEPFCSQVGDRASTYFGFAFKIGARQIVKQHINTKQEMSNLRGRSEQEVHGISSRI